MSNIIFAIDPGPTKSAFAEWDGTEIRCMGIELNDVLHSYIAECAGQDDTYLAIEQVACYGMPVGQTVFDTVFWSGRFWEIWAGEMPMYDKRHDPLLIPRMDVKMHICHDSRAKDGNIRQALIDRIGTQGTKNAPGPTYGCKADIWQALAVAVTAWDRMQEAKAKAKEKA